MGPDRREQDKDQRYQPHSHLETPFPLQPCFALVCPNKGCFEGRGCAADVNLLGTATGTNAVHCYYGLAAGLKPRSRCLLHLELGRDSAGQDSAHYS